MGDRKRRMALSLSSRLSWQNPVGGYGVSRGGDAGGVLALGDCKVVAGLQVQPEPGAGAEMAGEAERGIGADRSLAVQDRRVSPRRDAKRQRQAVGRHRSCPEFAPKDAARMDGDRRSSPSPRDHRGPRPRARPPPTSSCYVVVSGAIKSIPVPCGLYRRKAHGSGACGALILQSTLQIPIKRLIALTAGVPQNPRHSKNCRKSDRLTLC
jgi:hypothetical protein